MGFDRVVLLDIIANEPVSGVGIEAWLNASSRAHDATERMRSVLNDRITSGAAVDHFALSIGAVTGGEESLQGCGQPTLLHRGPPNFHGGDRNQISNRDTMNRNVRTFLKDQPKPSSYPCVYIDCKICQRMHARGNCRRR